MDTRRVNAQRKAKRRMDGIKASLVEQVEADLGILIKPLNLIHPVPVLIDQSEEDWA